MYRLSNLKMEAKFFVATTSINIDVQRLDSQKSNAVKKIREI